MTDLEVEAEDGGHESNGGDEEQSTANRHSSMVVVVFFWVGIAVGALATPDDATRMILLPTAIMLGFVLSRRVLNASKEEE